MSLCRANQHGATLCLVQVVRETVDPLPDVRQPHPGVLRSRLLRVAGHQAVVGSVRQHPVARQPGSLRQRARPRAGGWGVGGRTRLRGCLPQPMALLRRRTSADD